MTKPILVNGIWGFEKCPNWLKKKYLCTINKCQIKNCKETKNLQIHRKKRGNVGGLYTVCPINSKKSNVQVLCAKHHKLIHANEVGCR